jgi:hypothetical protein
MAKPETPKRLTPKPEVLRELFLRSGNQCAFRGCKHRVISDAGVYIAELCHIESALPEGERFNEDSNNEQRRSFDNLMLMCHEHHVTTDDVDEFPVERMRKIKRAHEAKYSGVVEKIEAGFKDMTKTILATPAQSLGRMNTVLKLHSDPAELRAMAKELRATTEKLRKVPIRTRQILEIILDRGEEADRGEIRVPYPDVLHAVECSERDFKTQIQLLEHHGFVWVDDYASPEAIVLSPISDEWSLWLELKLFCSEAGVDLASFLVDLRFDQLD